MGRKIKVGDYVLVVGTSTWKQYIGEIIKITKILNPTELLFPYFGYCIKDEMGIIKRFGEDELRLLTEEEVKNVWVFEI